MIELNHVPDAFETAIEYSGGFRYVAIGWSPFQAQLLMIDGQHLLYCQPFPFLYLVSEPASGITDKSCNMLPEGFRPKLQAEDRVARYGAHFTTCGALFDRAARTLVFRRFRDNMRFVQNGNPVIGGSFWPEHGILSQGGERRIPELNGETPAELFLDLKRRADNEVFSWIRERRF